MLGFWDLKIYFNAVQPFPSKDSEEIAQMREAVNKARKNAASGKIIREDQLHACFIKASDKDNDLARFFAGRHDDAISAMRRLQVDGTREGAELAITEDMKDDLLQNAGYFPPKEAVISLQEVWGYKALGMEGITQAVYNVEDPRPVLRYAKLGDWMEIWEGFHPLVNLDTVTDYMVSKGQGQVVLDFWQRVAALENHAALFKHEFDLKKSPHWPRPPSHHQKDDVKSPAFGADPSLN